MPNIKSAKKELRKSKSRAFENKKVKDKLKSLIKKTQKAIEAKDKKAEELLGTTMKAIDKAAKKGVIKTNTRDRKKSRLHSKFNKTQQGA